MQKACAGLAGKPCYMDCWLKASSVPWHSNILIGVWFRQDMRLVKQSSRLDQRTVRVP